MKKNTTPRDFPFRPGTRIHFVQGFALVEVMVTALLVFIGLLGLASAQIQSSRMTQQAEMQFRASLVIATLSESIRAHSTEAISGDFNIEATVDDISGLSERSDIVATQIVTALNRLTSIHVDPRLSINCRGDAVSHCQICVRWRSRDRHSDNSADIQVDTQANIQANTVFCSSLAIA